MGLPLQCWEGLDTLYRMYIEYMSISRLAHAAFLDSTEDVPRMYVAPPANDDLPRALSASLPFPPREEKLQVQVPRADAVLAQMAQSTQGRGMGLYLLAAPGTGWTSARLAKSSGVV